MNKKATIDITIVISCITGMVLSYVYLENLTEKQVSLTILGSVGILFLFLWFMDRGKNSRQDYDTGRTEISEILLLGEDNNIT
ncbi:MAG: FHA domain-containing protein, partial [Lachnospiraceae bacterium]|nr:FHA domain-containing protein [Lachnospiraceae bacterium]